MTSFFSIYIAILVSLIIIVFSAGDIWGEPYFSMEIYVERDYKYHKVMLYIVDDKWDVLEEDVGRTCMGSWMGCAMYGENPKIYINSNNGCILWHEIQHHQGLHEYDKRMFKGCGTWIGKGERLE